MEIVYDESGTRVILRKDDGTEVDILKLEGALVMAQESREFNRRRVVLLEDRLDRIRKILTESGTSLSDLLYTGEEVGDFQASEAELVAEQVCGLERKLARALTRTNRLEIDLKEMTDACSAQSKRADENHQRAERETSRADALGKRAEQAEERIRGLVNWVEEKNRTILHLQQAVKVERERAERAENDARNFTLEGAEIRRRISTQGIWLNTATTRIEKVREILMSNDDKSDPYIVINDALLALDAKV